MKLKQLFLTLGLLFFSLGILGDEALYGKVPPADAAFFRFVNATENTLELYIDGKKAPKLAPRDVSRFAFSSEGELPLTINGEDISIDLVANTQLSIVWHEHGDSAYTIIQEQPFNDKKRARIRLFNLTNQDGLELKTTDGKHQVVSSVEPLGAEYRDVNAIRLPFAAVKGDAILATTDPIALSRDKATSIFAFEMNESVLLTIKHAER